MQEEQRETSLEVNNEKALQQLAWAIENSAGKFKLILARCNYASLRSRIISRLKEICPVEINVLQLRESGRTLFAAIGEEFGEDLPAALMVLGLDRVEGLPQMLTAVNQVREDFRKHFPFPLVLWINDDVYKQLMQFAPDFESWATSKNFVISQDDLGNYFKNIANSWFHNTISLNRYDLINLHSELEAAGRDLLAGAEKDNWELEADLESLLGFVYQNSDRNDITLEIALDHYQKALNLWQQDNPAGISLEEKLERQAKIIAEICICSYWKAIKHVDKNHPDWRNTRKYIQEYLNLVENNENLDLNKYLRFKIGEILRDLQEWQVLRKLFQKLLERHKLENKTLDIVKDYGFLAEAALGEESWQEANNYSRQALKILWGMIGLEYSHDTGWCKYLLARSQYNLGKKSEATRNLEAAKELSESQKNLRFYLDILIQLQKLYFEQKEYLKAYDIKQEQFSVEQQFGLRAFIGAGRLQSFKDYVFGAQDNINIQNTKYSEKIAPEIAASTRQLDVERLFERVGRNDYKLTVIYGQSGVGKSSLLNAGLEPALRNNAIGIKDNLPVVMRVYTNWLEELARQIGFEGLSTEIFESTEIFDKLLKKLTEIEQRNLRTILIFDQFEEFFFVCTELEQRRDFFVFLADCLNILSVKVILSLRVDYLHYLLECNKLPNMNIIGNDILSSNILYELGNFKPNDAKSIIQRLTEGANFSLEAALVDKLVEDLAGTLGEVRPIELQIVGAQLQADNINSLVKYDLLGKKVGSTAKEELVERYLQAVVENCGAENMQVAELLLYSLTDEKGTRPLKTHVELQKDLEELTLPQPSPLQGEGTRQRGRGQFDLVLEILVKSGLVLLLPEITNDRYQLVHDYIAAFIRQQQEPKLKVLMDELGKERQQITINETKLNKFLKRALAGSIVAGFWLALLSVITVYQAWRSK